MKSVIVPRKIAVKDPWVQVPVHRPMMHSTTVPLDLDIDADFVTASTPMLLLDGMGDIGL